MQRPAEPPAAPAAAVYGVDGDRLLMVAMELVMGLFGLLYAFPHVPSRLLDVEAAAWFSVATHDSLKVALLKLLQGSPVLVACLAEVGHRPEDLRVWDLCSLEQLDALLGLNVFADGVPTTCRQMYLILVQVFRAVLLPPVDPDRLVVTQDWLTGTYRQHGLLSNRLPARGGGRDRPDLLRFCTEHTVAWLQPYFASDPLFFHPRGLLTACA